MALCEQCGNFDDNEVENDDGIFHLGKRPKRRVGYQPDLYFYWHGDIEEDYDMGDYDCLCECCFDILNREGKIKWKDNMKIMIVIDATETQLISKSANRNS